MNYSHNFLSLLILSLACYCLVCGQPPKYSSLWARQVVNDTTRQLITSVGVDGQGNVYVLGQYDTSIDLGGSFQLSSPGTNVFLVKYNSEGTILWAKSIGGDLGQSPIGIAVSSDGNVWVAGNWFGTITFGTTQSTANNEDIFVALYDSDGTLVWGKALVGGQDQSVLGMTVDSAKNLYITGTNVGTINFGGGNIGNENSVDTYVAKYNVQGNFVWAKPFGTYPSAEKGRSITTDPTGNVIVATTTTGTINFGGGDLKTTDNTYDCIAIAKLDAAGNHLWSKIFTGATVNNVPEGVTTDANGNIYLTGTASAGVDFGLGPSVGGKGANVFLAKFSPAGALLWSGMWGDDGTQGAASVVVDSNSDVYIVGYFAGTISFGGNTFTAPKSYSGFIAKFDSTGKHLFSRGYGNTTLLTWRDIAMDTTSLNYYLVGDFSGGYVDFDNSVRLSQNSLSDGLVAKFYQSEAQVDPSTFVVPSTVSSSTAQPSTQPTSSTSSTSVTSPTSVTSSQTQTTSVVTNPATETSSNGSGTEQNTASSSVDASETDSPQPSQTQQQTTTGGITDDQESSNAFTVSATLGLIILQLLYVTL